MPIGRFMKYRYIYKVMGKLSHTSQKLEKLNEELSKIGAGFTLGMGTDKPIQLMSFQLDVSMKEDHTPIMPVDWQEEVLRTIKETMGRHQIILSDAYLEIKDKFEIKEEEV